LRKDEEEFLQQYCGCRIWIELTGSGDEDGPGDTAKKAKHI